MAAVAHYPVRVPAGSDEQRVLLNGVSWDAYVALRDSIQSSAVMMTYLEGQLEIMSPSKEHEITTKQIARLLELFCLERGIPLYGYRSTTFKKRDAERGLEPGECYTRDRDRDVPEVAIEVIVSHGLLDKLEVYRGLGIREVWLFEKGAFRVLTLQTPGYVPIAASEVFPEVDLGELARHALEPDQHKALVAYRDSLRSR